MKNAKSPKNIVSFWDEDTIVSSVRTEYNSYAASFMMGAVVLDIAKISWNSDLDTDQREHKLYRRLRALIGLLLASDHYGPPTTREVERLLERAFIEDESKGTSYLNAISSALKSNQTTEAVVIATLWAMRLDYPEGHRPTL